MADIYNPLANVIIGSTVNEIKDKDSFSVPVFKKSITKMSPETSYRTVMTGQSSAVYSNMMNRGSLGISGGYGVSGISKVSASLSGYVGQSSATDAKTTRIDCHALLNAGIQYTDFDNLDTATLIAALSDSIRDKAIAALDAYQALLAPNLNESDKRKYLQAWTKARKAFFDVAGNGVVVGVLWGAIASVSLEITQSSDSNTNQYGGNGNFTYAGLNASVSVEAAYDGSNASSSVKVTPKVTSYYTGKALADEAKTWANDFKGKVLSELANTKIAESPSIPQSNKIAAPSVPPLVEPKADPAIAAKLANLKNKQELDKLTKEAHKVELNKTDEEYKQLTNKKADIGELDGLITRARSNAIITRPDPQTRARSKTI